MTFVCCFVCYFVFLLFLIGRLPYLQYCCITKNKSKIKLSFFQVKLVWLVPSITNHYLGNDFPPIGKIRHLMMCLETPQHDIFIIIFPSRNKYNCIVIVVGYVVYNDYKYLYLVVFYRVGIQYSNGTECGIPVSNDSLQSLLTSFLFFCTHILYCFITLSKKIKKLDKNLKNFKKLI